MKRPTDVKLVRGALALIAAGLSCAACAGSVGPAASGNHRSHPPASPSHRSLSAWLELPSPTVPAGSSISGRVVVRNLTGRPVPVWGCVLFEVLLDGNGYRPVPAWPLCLRRFLIPVGESSYPVTVTATYNRCSERPTPSYGTPCLPGGLPPPLPPGSYRAIVYAGGHRLPVPAPVPVRVTS